MLVIVPAYNEARNIPVALRDLAEHAPSADVVVVDDGSSDETAEAARACGAKVLSLPCNLGVGGAVQTGYRYAWANGYDVAVQFDADAQHRADQIGPLVDRVTDGADLAVGSRLLEPGGYRFGLARYLGSRALSWMVSLIARQRITDPTSGFRAASRRAIRFFAHH
ncbi:MAG: glycosyltransferase family 2 protein, partial [Planctomycetota bacterium]